MKSCGRDRLVVVDSKPLANFIKKQRRSFSYQFVNFSHDRSIERTRLSSEDTRGLDATIFVKIVAPSRDTSGRHIKNLRNLIHLPALLEQGQCTQFHVCAYVTEDH